MQKNALSRRCAGAHGYVHAPKSRESERFLTKTLLVAFSVFNGNRSANRNTFLAMKLTFVFLTAAFLNVTASAVSQNISYSGTNVPLIKVFREVEMQTGLVFFYERGLLNNTHPVTVKVDDMPLTNFMDLILSGQPLKFNIESKTINISRKPLVIGTPNVVFDVSPVTPIKGRVVNEKGEAVPGITISVKNGNVAALTDSEGKFVFNVIEPNTVLIFSGINYQTREVPVRNNTTFVVVLAPKVVQLESITVGRINTGYQVLDKVRATGAYGKPDMEVFAKRVGTVDIIERLEGQVTGLQIMTGSNPVNANTNGNGVTTRKSLVRGTTSVQLAPEPLYVVNGIVVAEMSAVNPDDIEDITVLKDAAASAIYGARAANGVIIITTKSGSKSQRLTVSYNGFASFMGKPDFGYLKNLNSQQYIQLAKEIFDPVANPFSSLTYSVIPPHDQILYDQNNGLISAEEADRRLDSLASINNQSQIKDIWYRNSITHNHTVSVSGGNNTYSFYGSLGYTGGQEGAPGSVNHNYKINFTQSVNAGKRVRIQLNTSLINAVSQSKHSISVGAGFLPYQLFRDEQGNNLYMNYMNGYSPALAADYSSRSRISLDYNPLDELEMGYSKMNNLTLNVTANVNVNLVRGLSFNGTYGYQKAPGNSIIYADNRLLTQRQQIIGLTIAPDVNSTPEYLIPTTGGNYITENNDQRNWTVRNQLAYDIAPANGRDHLTLQAGQEVNEGFNERETVTLIGYNDKLGTYAQVDYKRLSAGVPGTVTGWGSLWATPYWINRGQTRFISYFGLASYTYNDKYSIDANVRQDMSNQFANTVSTQNRPAFSIGGKWQMAKEAFMTKVKWINDFAIRATYGITGNSPYVGAASMQDILYAIIPNSWGGSYVGGEALAVSRVANKNLTWERTSTINFGIDVAMLNRRLGASFNYYRKTTTDMIGSIRLNPFSGQSSITGNLGEMYNRGLEITLRSENIRASGFTWSTVLNFSHNKNKLISYSVPQPWSNTASSRVGGGTNVAGYSLNSLWAYKFAGLDNVGDPQIYLTDKSVSKDPNIATVDDVYHMGITLPPVHGGLSNNFSYKGLNLAVNMVYNFGAVMRRDVNSFYSGRLFNSASFSGGNYPVYVMDRWKQPGDEAFTDIPSYVANSGVNWTRRNTQYYTSADIHVISADYVKVRDITLSWDLPAAALSRLKMQRINIYLQTTNFMVWKANDADIDPEFHDFSYGGRGVRPYKHGYNVGLNLTF